jgi:hypothetical protein
VLHGVLCDGAQHRSVFPTLCSGAPSGIHDNTISADGGGGAASKKAIESCDARLGRELRDEWWVKAKLTRADRDGKEVYHCCRGKGRSSEYMYQSRAQVDEALASIDHTPHKIEKCVCSCSSQSHL